MSAKLFVGNLSFNITENDLQDAFAAHGTVVEANLMMDRATGRPRGFAFITMSTPEEAQKAITDHAYSVGFSKGYLVSAGIALLALIITVVAIRVKREDLSGINPMAAPTD